MAVSHWHSADARGSRGGAGDVSGAQPDALHRLTRLVSALDAAAARLQESSDAEAIPRLVGEVLHALDIESFVSLLDTPLEATGHASDAAMDAAVLRYRYISVKPDLLAGIESLIGSTVMDQPFPLTRVESFAEVARTHRPMYLADTARIVRQLVPELSPDKLPELSRLAHAQTGIVAPLLSRGHMLGMMAVWANDLRPEDTAVLAAFARQAAVALDNARLSAEAEHRARHLSALSEIAREISSTLQLGDVLSRIVTRAASALHTDHAGLWLVDHPASAPDHLAGASAGVGAHAIRLAAHCGLSVEHQRLGDAGAESDRCANEFILRISHARGPSSCDDLLDASPDEVPPALRQFLLNERFRAFVATPLVTPSNQAIGALVVYSSTPSAYCPEDSSYLEAIGGHAAIAIEQAQLFHAITAGRALLASIFEVGPGAIAVIDGPNDVIQMANPRLRTFTATPDDDPVGCSIHEIFPAERISLVNGLRATLEGVRYTRRPVMIRGVTLRSGAGLPDRVITLNVAPIQLGASDPTSSGQPGDLRAGDGAPVVSADALVLDLWDTTAHVRAEARLAAQVRRAETLARVGAALQSERELPALLQFIAEAARDLTDAETSGFLLRPSSQAAFEVAAIASIHPHTKEALRRPSVPKLRLFQPLLQEGRTILMDDASTAFAASDMHFLKRTELRALAATPLVASGGWVLGGLVVAHRDAGSFTNQHIELLSALAAQAAAAVERTRALEEARQRADELETTFASMTDGVAIYDTAGALLRMNAAGERMTRRLMERGSSIDERSYNISARYPDGRPVPLSDLPSARAVRGDVFQDVEYLINGEDGPDTAMRVSGTPLVGLDGERHGAVIVYRNVTRVQRLEARTQVALAALLRIAGMLVAPTAPHEAETSSDDEHATSPALRATLRHFCELTIDVLGCDRVAINLVDPQTHAMTPGAVAGLDSALEASWLAQQQAQWQHDTTRHVEDLYSPEQKARFLAGEAIVLDMTQSSTSDLADRFDTHMVLTVPMVVDDRIVGALALDHHARHPHEPPHTYTESEIALALGVARLGALAIDRQRLLHLRAEVEALRNANALKEEFLSIASHELRTPLTVLQARTQATRRRLLRMGYTDAADQFAPVQSSLDRILALVQELLDASRIEAGRLEFQSAPCDLAVLLTEAVREARDTHDRVILLEGADAPDLWIMGDRERLMQVFTNLLSNAMKYSALDKPIAVQIQRQRQRVPSEPDPRSTAAHPEQRDKIILTVSDQGVGIPHDEVDHIFERFYRARTSSPQQYGGLGLGLHIAATIVDRHRGRIWATSEGPATGSTFAVEFPAVEEPRGGGD